MLQLDNKYCEVSFLHFSGSKRNMSEAFCLVQCFVECIQLQNKDGQKRIIDKVLKKHLNIMVGSQQPLFLWERMAMKDSNIYKPLFSINGHYITSNIALLNKYKLKLT